MAACEYRIHHSDFSDFFVKMQLGRIQESSPFKEQPNLQTCLQ
jgi:hypothetical protein